MFREKGGSRIVGGFLVAARSATEAAMEITIHMERLKATRPELYLYTRISRGLTYKSRRPCILVFRLDIRIHPEPSVN